MKTTNRTYRAIKIRIFPNKEQEKILWKHINASRFIYNRMLEIQDLSYKMNLGYISRFNMINLLIKFKTEYEWLWTVSNTTLQITCTDVDKAYQLFFKGISRHPKFKSKKRSKKAFPTRADQVYFKNNKVNIDKVGKIRYQTNYELPEGKGNIKCFDSRVTFINNKWILSFSIECDNQTPKPDLTGHPIMGIDLGIKELAVVSYGNSNLKIHSINKTKKIKELERRKKHIERNLSRKYKQNHSFKHTKNIEKELKKLRRDYYRMHNIRHDYIHKTTHYLTKVLLPKRVVMETLDINDMMKNRCLSKMIMDQCIGTFIHHMKYKCEDVGIEFIQVPRLFPSSKMCSCCGNIKKDLKLGDRVYVCDVCGNFMDRDLNAAKNLRDYEP